MADFSFLSDSDDEKAVEEFLSLAKDQVVLEQVAAINCAGFTDSVLPTHLEARFQKLKSFPTSSPKSSSFHTHSTSSSSSSPAVKSPKPQSKSTPFEAKETQSNSGSDSDKNSVEGNGLLPSKSVNDDAFSPPKKNPGGKIERTPKSHTKSSSFGSKTQPNSGSDSDKNSVEKKGASHSKLFQNDIFSPSKKNPERKMAKNSKSPSGSLSATESTSPPQKSSCFWWSPKGASSEKMSGKENKRLVGMGIDWEMEDELLSDSNCNFSATKQRELLKKAMKVEEKINRDAEKIAKWSKQVSASAKMGLSRKFQ